MSRQPEPTEAEVEAALAALTEPDRFRAAEQRVARHVPELQRILNHALREGGWFDEAHESQLRRVAGAQTEDERLAALRALLAEETRLGMLVGVAVGWELGRELERSPAREE
ncbi:MAG TPA: hypothetical protein VK387_06190 [Thermoleophilaceae bacterium]|nr:hypothetical protein [Thermoleophilaceae bacterium]